MATRIWAINPNGQLDDVKENIGPTGTSAIIALVVDLATTAVNQSGVTRTVSREEVLNAIETFRSYILGDTWPPA